MEINKVYNGDCLEIMQGIPDKSVDMILCDLPYGTTACKWDVIIPFDKLWEQYERVIKDNGAIVLTASQPFTSALVMSKHKLFKYEWIWLKTRGGNFLNAKVQPMLQHENILVFGKGRIVYNPIKQERSGAGRLMVGKAYKTTKVTDNYGSFVPTATLRDELRYPISYQVFDTDRRQSLHPTQKPVALFEYLIKTYTHEGQTVLDNCMGSGTTAIACINTGRNYIGIEKEEKYYNIIQDRIKNHAPQLKLIA